MMYDRWLTNTLITLGAVGLLAGLTWWWLAFSEVISGDYISFSQAIFCIGGSSDLCTLALALCKSNHWLGITGYSATPFWLGLAMASGGIAVRSFNAS